MDFRDSLAAEMPVPRDDEPGGLRQDILDELADHLACSYARELLRGASPAEARGRAIERFGDPAAVARRLWLDAMRGKIMAQRVLIATCLVGMAACFGLVGLIWVQSNRAAAELAEANRRLAEAVSQSQANNQEKLRQLQAMAKASKSADWVPIRFRLTLEKPDGPPAARCQISLGRGHGGSTRDGAMFRTTDASGVADFGVVQPGDWEYLIRADPWTLTQSLNVLPGTPVDQVIVCPSQGAAPVKIRVRWPRPWIDKDFRAVAVFRHQNVQLEPTNLWVSALQNNLSVLCRSRDSRIAAGASVQLATIVSNGRAVHGKANPFGGDVHVLGLLNNSSLTPAEEALDLAAGCYELVRLMVFRPVKTRAVGYEVFVLLSQVGQGEEETPLGLLHLPTTRNSTPVFVASEIPVRVAAFPPPYLKALGRFETRPGQPAEWEIPLPEEMIKEVEAFREATIGDIEGRFMGDQPFQKRG